MVELGHQYGDADQICKFLFDKPYTMEDLKKQCPQMTGPYLKVIQPFKIFC